MVGDREAPWSIGYWRSVPMQKFASFLPRGASQRLKYFVNPAVKRYLHSSHQHIVLEVSYCDRYLSVRQSIRPSVVNNYFIRHLILVQWPVLKLNSEKCFLGVPLQKLLTWFGPLNKITARATNYNNNCNKTHFKRHHLLSQWCDLKIISQKCFLGEPLSKLLKWILLSRPNYRES